MNLLQMQMHVIVFTNFLKPFFFFLHLFFSHTVHSNHSLSSLPSSQIKPGLQQCLSNEQHTGLRTWKRNAAVTLFLTNQVASIGQHFLIPTKTLDQVTKEVCKHTTETVKEVQRRSGLQDSKRLVTKGRTGNKNYSKGPDNLVWLPFPLVRTLR